MGFLIGATDTTPSALSHGILWLKLNPDIWKKLVQEIDSLIP